MLPGPSGYEGPVRAVWKDAVAEFADRVEVDVHGNTIGVHNEAGGPKIMFAGHADELGFQIVYIDDKGYLYFDTIGGFDLQIVPGRKVRIHTAQGPVLGVLGKKPIHLMKEADRTKVPDKHDLWIDIGAADADEARQLVAIGDPATYDANFEELRNGLVVSRGIDNKARCLGGRRGAAAGQPRQAQVPRRSICGGHHAGGSGDAWSQD